MADQHEKDYLPQEYDLQYCVQYDCATKGHYWECVDKKKWGLLADDGNLIPFCDYSTQIKNILDLFQPISPPPLLSFFCGNSSTMPCPPELTLVLNSIVRHDGFDRCRLITSFCDGNVTLNVRGAPQNRPCWTYLADFDVDKYLADFILILLIKKKITRGRIKRELRELRRAFTFIRTFHDFCSCEKINIGKRTCFRILLRCRTKVIDYMRGRVCGCLPIPGHVSSKVRKSEFLKNEHEVVSSPEVVVASPVVRKALEQLNYVWQDTFARTVLISAPPGSGKEDFSKSIPYGNGRRTDNFHAISMADCDVTSFQRRLYGYEGMEEGLIKAAEDSALFLDEIHQPGPNQEQSLARTSLLRVLEAGKYYAVNGIKSRDVGNVQFIMATSVPLSKLGEYNPKDFWTRMTHAIEIPHPLSFTSFSKGDATMSIVLSKFFNHFWWMRIEDFYRMAPAFDSPHEEIRTRAPKAVVFWKVHSMTQVMGFICRDAGNSKLIPRAETDERNFPYKFAEIFNECLSTHPNIQEARDFSIRGIRNMVTRLFSIAASNIEKGIPLWEDEGSFISDVQKAFREIAAVANLR